MSVNGNAPYDSGNMGRFRIGVGSLVVFCLLISEARGAGRDLAAACRSGAGFSSLEAQIFRREADLLALMGRESAFFAPLEKKRDEFKLADQTLSAAEFSVAALSLNGMILGILGSGGASASGAQAVAVANRMATLRQVVNASLGTVSIVWAASYHSEYGEMLPQEVGPQDMEKGMIREEITQGYRPDKAYAAAQRHLSNIIAYFSNLDNSIRQREIKQHELHWDTVSPMHVEETEGCTLALQNGSDSSPCNSERMWRMIKYVLPGMNYWHQKAVDTDIDLAAISSHLKLYIQELQFLFELHGQLLAHCELKTSVLAKAKEATPITPASVWAGVVNYSKQIRQLPNGDAAPALPVTTAAR
jgi:hypothetical protein